MKNLINFEDFWLDEYRNVAVPEESLPALEVKQEVLKSKPKRKRRSIKEGLWFQADSGRYSTTIPKKGGFEITYDGCWMGIQYRNFSLEISDQEPHMMKLKINFEWSGYIYEIGRQLTLDDFEIVENPDYRANI